MNRQKTTLLCLLLFFSMYGMGCSSISGKHLKFEGGTVDEKKSIGGLPIRIQRPTHAAYVVTFIKQNNTDGTSTYKPVISDKPLLYGPYEFFSIDIKRPMAGKIDYKVDLDNYYPSSIGAEIEDQTLEKSGEVLSDIAKKIIEGFTGSGAESAVVDVSKDNIPGMLLIINLENGNVYKQEFSAIKEWKNSEKRADDESK